MSIRPAVAAVALAVGLAGLASSLWFGADAGAQAGAQTHEIWITDDGFNPSTCVVRRNDSVRWVNKSSVVRNVEFDQLTLPGSPNTPYSTGDIQPGASSGDLSLTVGLNSTYHDKYDQSLTGSVATTVNGAANCDQVPPTPTPTPTTSASPTPTATPTPDWPESCDGAAGCAVVAGVAHDE